MKKIILIFAIIVSIVFVGCQNPNEVPDFNFTNIEEQNSEENNNSEEETQQDVTEDENSEVTNTEENVEDENNSTEEPSVTDPENPIEEPSNNEENQEPENTDSNNEEGNTVEPEEPSNNEEPEEELDELHRLIPGLLTTAELYETKFESAEEVMDYYFYSGNFELLTVEEAELFYFNSTDTYDKTAYKQEYLFGTVSFNPSNGIYDYGVLCTDDEGKLNVLYFVSPTKWTWHVVGNFKHCHIAYEVNEETFEDEYYLLMPIKQK